MFPENWREQVVTEARTWKGTRYVHKGRVKGVGVDCGGLIYQLFSPFLPLPPFPKDYPQDWAMHRNGNELYLDFIMPFVAEIEEPVKAGLALFQVGRNFSHGAICTGEGTFVHAYGRTGYGCVREDGLSFFKLGEKRRLVKYFDVGSQWLSPSHERSRLLAAWAVLSLAPG